MNKEEVVSALDQISDHLTFRLINKSDIDLIMQWEIEHQPLVGHWNREKHLKTIENPHVVQIIIAMSSKDENAELHDKIESVGFIILDGIDREARILEFARILVIKPGRGIGTSIIKSVQQVCFTNMKYHRLWLDVLATNERAFSLYQHLGFIHEGTLRDSDYYKGEYNSMDILSILESEYERK